MLIENISTYIKGMQSALNDSSLVKEKDELEKLIFNLSRKEYNESLTKLGERLSAPNDQANLSKTGIALVDHLNEIKKKREDGLVEKKPNDTLKLIEAFEVSRDFIHKASERTLTKEEYNRHHQYARNLCFDPDPATQKTGRLIERLFTVVLLAAGIASFFTPIGWIGAAAAAGSIVLFKGAASLMRNSGYYTSRKPMHELEEEVGKVNKSLYPVKKS